MHEHIEAYSSIANVLNFRHFYCEQTSRSMTKRNQKLFDRLKNLSEENGFDKNNFSYHEKICIETSETEKDWLQKISSHEDLIISDFEIVNIEIVFPFLFFTTPVKSF